MNLIYNALSVTVNTSYQIATNVAYAAGYGAYTLAAASCSAAHYLATNAAYTAGQYTASIVDYATGYRTVRFGGIKEKVCLLSDSETAYSDEEVRWPFFQLLMPILSVLFIRCMISRLISELKTCRKEEETRKKKEILHQKKLRDEKLFSELKEKVHKRAYEKELNTCDVRDRELYSFLKENPDLEEPVKNVKNFLLRKCRRTHISNRIMESYISHSLITYASQVVTQDRCSREIEQELLKAIIRGSIRSDHSYDARDLIFKYTGYDYKIRHQKGEISKELIWDLIVEVIRDYQQFKGPRRAYAYVYA